MMKAREKISISNINGLLKNYRYSKAPEQWRKRMAAKEGTLKAFADVFKDGGRLESTDQSDQDKLQDSDRRRVKDSKLDKSIDVKKRRKIQQAFLLTFHKLDLYADAYETTYTLQVTFKNIASEKNRVSDMILLL